MSAVHASSLAWVNLPLQTYIKSLSPNNNETFLFLKNVKTFHSKVVTFFCKVFLHCDCLFYVNDINFFKFQVSHLSFFDEKSFYELKKFNKVECGNPRLYILMYILLHPCMCNYIYIYMCIHKYIHVYIYGLYILWRSAYTPGWRSNQLGVP